MKTAESLSRLVAIDVETSGPDPFRHQLLAVAIVPLDRRHPTLELFIRQEPVCWSSIGRQYFDRYRAQWESNAVSPDEALGQINHYLAELPEEELMLVGHNVGFDFSFLKSLLRHGTSDGFNKLSHRSVDTHTLLQVARWQGLAPLDSCSSSEAFAYFGVEPPNAERHTALADAIATASLTRKLVEALSERQRTYSDEALST